MDIEKLKDVISEEEVLDYISKLVSIPSYNGLERQEEEIANNEKYLLLSLGLGT